MLAQLYDHCMPSNLFVHVVLAFFFSWQITHIHLHPQFTGGLTPSHDLALVRMEIETIFSHQVYPACVQVQTDHFPVQETAAVSKITINEAEHIQQYKQHSQNKSFKQMTVKLDPSHNSPSMYERRHVYLMWYQKISVN